MARWALLNLETQRYHVKNWRPNLLVFTGQPHNRESLVEVAEWLSMGQGVVSFFQLLVGDVRQIAGHRLRSLARRQIRSYIQDRHMTAFAEADVVADFYAGAVTVAQAHGVGGLEPNAVLLGWSRTAEGRSQQIQLMDTLVELGKSVLFLQHDATRGFGRKKVIDVWWRGRSHNADLMMLLAHIVAKHPSWRGARVRLLRVIHAAEGVQQTEDHLRQLLDEVRLAADPVVIVAPETQSFAQIAIEWSQQTDLTLLGMNRPQSQEQAPYAEQLNELVSTLGTVLLVHSAGEEKLLEAEM